MNEQASKRPLVNYRQLALLVIIVGLYVAGRYVSNSNERHSGDVLEQLAEQPLVLTDHGRCRMECREISLSEVRSILHSGEVNIAKSDPSDEPCPAWAVEGETADGQEVRIVFAACDRETRVITAIDLENSYDCDCD